MIYVTFFCSVFFLLYFFLHLRKGKKERVERRLSVFVHQKEEVQENKEEERVSPFKKITLMVWNQYKRGFRKRMLDEKEEKIELKLLRAGNPFGMTPVEFRISQRACTLITPLLFTGYSVLIQLSLSTMIMLGIVGVLAGILLPHYYLTVKMKVRSQLVIRELPDILDLLTVSLEAGLGFDSAIGKVVAKKNGVLSNEFHRCLEEIRLGKTRREALSGIRDRIVADEINVLISSILQAEKLGIGMVQVLRIQSNEVRARRRQRAEEEAMKAPIKMLFPLVLFIFPSIFIVLLGPAIIQFLTTFK
jgi:tight adherence protein C